jgi:hypothetical protein
MTTINVGTVTQKKTMDVEVPDSVSLKNYPTDTCSLRVENMAQNKHNATLRLNGWNDGKNQTGLYVTKESLREWCAKVLEVLDETS